MRAGDGRGVAGRLAAALIALVWLSAGAGLAEPREEFRIRLVNAAGGEIAVSRDQGAAWTKVGEVLRFTTQVNRKGYTASKWATPGHVAATAVNALHINAGYNAEDDRGIVFSLLPREFFTAPEHYSSFLSPDSSIYTDIPAGRSIFGGGAAPFVGSAVFVDRGILSPLPAGYVPTAGDVLVIVVAKPARYPVEAVLENRAGGMVTLGYADGSHEQIGRVVRPVQGVGRFVGGVYADIGRLRANHTGVIDVSTSPIGKLGGFQIIPLGHAHSPEMGNAWTLTQWMIVEPIDDGPGLWHELAPLFGEHLRPDYLPDDLYAQDWESRLLARFLVDADLGRGWQPMPPISLSADPQAPLPEWAGAALAQVQRLRLLFPLAERQSIEP